MPTTKARPTSKRVMAKTQATPEVKAKFQTCQACPNPSICGFEEQCDDLRKGAGRPTLYSDAIANEIIEALLSGMTIKRWCEAADGRPSRVTVHNWQRARPDFFTSIAQAREDGFVESLIDDILDIADDGRNDTYRDANGNDRVDTEAIQRSKLRVESRFRLAEKLNPGRYGQRVDFTVREAPMDPLERDQRIGELMEALGLAAPMLALSDQTKH